MRLTPFIILAVMGSACGVTTDVVLLNPAAPAYTPVSPDSVHIFANSNNVLIDYEAIATISADASASGVIAPDEAAMLTVLGRRPEDWARTPSSYGNCWTNDPLGPPTVCYQREGEAQRFVSEMTRRKNHLSRRLPAQSRESVRLRWGRLSEGTTSLWPTRSGRSSSRTSDSRSWPTDSTP